MLKVWLLSCINKHMMCKVFYVRRKTSTSHQRLLSLFLDWSDLTMYVRVKHTLFILKNILSTFPFGLKPFGNMKAENI